MNKWITLAEGGGGQESARLVAEFAEILGLQNAHEDAGVFSLPSPMAMSTDSFTILPLFFPGGDIGKLSVCGSLNDVAMMGAKPAYLTCGLVIEEGFSRHDLRAIVQSMACELRKADVQIVSGDTKVVERGGVKGLVVNTTAVGAVRCPALSARNLAVGDAVILSGAAGTHGALIFALREEIGLQSALQSDCAQLYPVVAPLFDADLSLHALRDATRGGVAAVLNEWAIAANVGIVIERERIALLDEVRGICELLGLDALTLANEGAAVIALPKENAERALAILQQNGATHARIIGEVVGEHRGRVVCEQRLGSFVSRQYLEYPNGEFLPRIC
ncbi:MAG: hydrogenase expression/formation protein HypE [Helicobacter sp.]|nr:hydrogenase expression/formation protein HypE [Helicobacter sp.]